MKPVSCHVSSGQFIKDTGVARYCPNTAKYVHAHSQKLCKAKINNMLVSGNMTPQKMGRKVGKIFYFKKKFCPIFYFMTHLFPTAQLKNRGVEAPRP